MDTAEQRPPRILLGQLAAFGDCLLATSVARQLKHDFPGSHLTWAIARPYRQVIDDNPYVDVVWEIPAASRTDAIGRWPSFVREARRRKRQGEFDMLVFTQVPPDNWGNFDGTVRASLLRGYGRPITVPLQPVLRLRPEEVDSVRRFAERHSLSSYRNVILCECSAQSGQSFLTLPLAQRVARIVTDAVQDCAFIISSSDSFTSPSSRIIDGSTLPFRQNAELTKYCTLFVGAMSGITWLCATDWAKPLPMIQAISRSMSVFSSVVVDAHYFGLPSEHILEMTDCPPERLASCVKAILENGFNDARRAYHEEIEVDLGFYFEIFLLPLLKRGKFLSIARSLRTAYARYGPEPFRYYFRRRFDSL